jgi:hypothetical protein
LAQFIQPSFMIDLLTGKRGAAINGCRFAAVIAASRGFAHRENDSRNRIRDEIEISGRRSTGEGCRRALTEILRG